VDMDFSPLNPSFPSLQPELVAWSRSERPFVACCLPAPSSIGQRPDAQVIAEAFSAGTDRVELEVSESWPLGPLNTGAVAADPLTGVGFPWSPDRPTPFTDVGPCNWPDIPGWPDVAEHTDCSGVVDLAPWLPDALIRGDRPLSQALSALIEADPLIDGSGMDDFPMLNCNPLRPPLDCSHCVDFPTDDQPRFVIYDPFESFDYDARDQVPSYLAYQEFIQQNPGWREDYMKDRVVIQIIIASSYEPSVWLENPLAAAAFDAWYEKYWIPFNTPDPGLPGGQDQPLPDSDPTSELLFPGFPPDHLIIRFPSSAVSGNDPLYLAFTNFLTKNPGWLTEYGGELSTCAITPSRYVASIALSGSREALAFDAWYLRHHLLALDPVEGPADADPIVAPDPGLPTDPLIIGAPGSAVSGNDPLYLAFTNFLTKNPGWLTMYGGELGTCAITPSRHVASIWLSGSQEALAFDAWYELQRPLELDPVQDPADAEPIVPPFAPDQMGAATEPPLGGPTAAVSGSIRSDWKQVENRSQPDFLDPTPTLLVTPPVDGPADRVAADSLPLDQARLRRISDDEPDQLFAPRKVLDLPDWLPLHLRG
jgi:hypothetical protein